MDTIKKPWGYDVSMEKLHAIIGNDMWFSAKSTGGNEGDVLHVFLPTDPESLQVLREWLATR